MAEKEDKKNGEKLKDRYEELRKKYDLPKFDDFNAEFDIIKIDPEINMMHELRRAITHKLQAFAEWFEPVLNPNQNSLHSMVETKIFEKVELEPLFNLYKRMWHLVHQGLWASLQSEAEGAKFVKLVWQEWPELKAEVSRHVKKLADGWQSKSKEGEDSGYVS